MYFFSAGRGVWDDKLRLAENRTFSNSEKRKRRFRADDARHGRILLPGTSRLLEIEIHSQTRVFVITKLVVTRLRSFNRNSKACEHRGRGSSRVPGGRGGVVDREIVINRGFFRFTDGGPTAKNSLTLVSGSVFYCPELQRGGGGADTVQTDGRNYLPPYKSAGVDGVQLKRPKIIRSRKTRFSAAPRPYHRIVPFCVRRPRNPFRIQPSPFEPILPVARMWPVFDKNIDGLKGWSRSGSFSYLKHFCTSYVCTVEQYN